MRISRCQHEVRHSVCVFVVSSFVDVIVDIVILLSWKRKGRHIRVWIQCHCEFSQFGINRFSLRGVAGHGLIL